MRLAAILIAFTVSASTQAKPDLSGHWIVDNQPTPITGRIPICNTDCTIMQTDTALTVSEGMHRSTYKISETPAEVLSRSPGVTAKLTTTVKWDGVVLVISELIESADLNGGKPFTTTARLSGIGGVLAIEGIRSTKDGAVEPFKVVYKRVS
jgi:hypothetical protein